MPPRKSTNKTKKVAKAPASDSDYVSDEEREQSEAEVEEEEDYEASPPTKKKAKKDANPSGGAAKSKGKGKGRKNRLEVFNAMPLDVLIEIMQHLDPKTLLAMSRTCSIFRTVLHSKGGLSAWKMARRNVGLGDLTRPDVEEWELAQLLFDGTCVVCGKSRAVTLDSVLFVRGCKTCMRGNSNRLEKLHIGQYHKRAFEVVPFSLWSPIWDAEPMKFFWIPMLARVTLQLRALENEPRKLEEFIQSRKNIQKQAQGDAHMIENWQQQQKAAANNAKDDKRAARAQKILSKLRLEGYEEVDLQSYELKSHADFNNGRELTDNVWQRIKPIFTSLLDEERSRRLAREAAQRLKARAFALKSFYRQIETALPPSSTTELRLYFPPFANFLSLPSVKPLYEAEEYVPSAEDLLAAKPRVLADVEAFATIIRNSVLSNLLAANKTLDPDFDPYTLSLTSCLSALKCPSKLRCVTYSTFPAILEHVRICFGDSQAITRDSLTTDPVQITAIRRILEAVSHGKETKPNEHTSIAALYALGDTFECQTCELKQGSDAPALGVATWSKAYTTKGLNWAHLLDHIKTKHATEDFSIAYTPLPPQPPADSETLEKDDEPAQEVQPGPIEG